MDCCTTVAFNCYLQMQRDSQKLLAVNNCSNCNTKSFWNTTMDQVFFPKPTICLLHVHFGLLSELPGVINHHRCDSCSCKSGQYKQLRLPVEQGLGLLKLGREHAEGIEMGTSPRCPTAILRNSCLCAVSPLHSTFCALDWRGFQSVLFSVLKRPFWCSITSRSSQQQTSVLSYTASLPCTYNFLSLWGTNLSTLENYGFKGASFYTFTRRFSQTACTFSSDVLLDIRFEKERKVQAWNQ